MIKNKVNLSLLSYKKFIFYTKRPAKRVFFIAVMGDVFCIDIVNYIFMKIFIINGHKYYPFAQGRLNKTLFDKVLEILADGNQLMTTVIEDGYKLEDEVEKFQQADIVIFQMPINWFSFPAVTKAYIDDVYRHGVFYGPSESYGRGGLMTGKKYMYSLTWNSPKEAFLQSGGFFDGRGVDEVIVAMHKVQEFCGFERIPSFSCFNVVHNPDIPKYLNELELHLRKYFY